MRLLLFWIVLAFFASAQAESLENYSAHEQQNGRLVIHAGIPVVVITPYTDRILRVSLFPDGVIHDDTSSELVLTPQIVAWQLAEHDSHLVVTTAELTLDIQKYPLRLRFIRNGRTLLADENGMTWQSQQRGVRFNLTLGEHLYGGGERAAGLDLRGQQLDFYNFPHYCYGFGEQNMNIAIPFLLSSKGYGIYFEDPYPGSADLGHTSSTVMEYTVTGGNLSYFLIGGGNSRENLSAYAELTGKAALPPRWALGYLQSRYGYQSETEARNVVTAFRNQHVPLDGIILDLYWYGTGQMGDFGWDYSHWPNPTGMIRDFDSLGVKTILITEPYFVLTSSNYGTAQAAGYFARDSSGNAYVLPNFWFGPASLLDITNPDAAEWLWGLYAGLMTQGVGGWWCDLGEPEMHPAQMVHYAGSADRVHNIYSLAWAKLLDRHYRESYPQQRLFNLTRSGYAGMPHYGAIPWSGDVQRTFSGLQAQIPILLNMGLSGIPFTGCDVGGFSCSPFSSDLYVRWMQFAAFSPLMRAHGTDVVTEPVYLDSTTRNIVRDYIRWRYELLPYNYSLAWEACRSGVPQARPLNFDVPNEAAANLYDEYLWGDAFLVAPILSENSTARLVYLPDGTWIDYWSEQTYSGLRTVNVDAPLNRLPLFVKSNSIVPMVPPLETTKNYSSDMVIIHYYPDFTAPSAPYTMYDDDGRTPDAYNSGHYETVTITPQLGNISAVVQLSRDNHGYPGAPDTRHVIFQFHRITSAPSVVRFAGYPLPVVGGLTELQAADSAVYYDTATRRLYAAFHWSGAAEALEVESLMVLDAPNRVERELTLQFDAAYPNPFNSSAVIRYTVPSDRRITLTVFDLLGREVATLVDGRVSIGEHAVVLDGSGLGSGVYFCRLSDGVNVRTQKLVLLK